MSEWTRRHWLLAVLVLPWLVGTLWYLVSGEPVRIRSPWVEIALIGYMAAAWWDGYMEGRGAVR